MIITTAIQIPICWAIFSAREFHTWTLVPYNSIKILNIFCSTFEKKKKKYAFIRHWTFIDTQFNWLYRFSYIHVCSRYSFMVWLNSGQAQLINTYSIEYRLSIFAMDYCTHNLLRPLIKISKKKKKIAFTYIAGEYQYRLCILSRFGANPWYIRSLWAICV